MIAGHSFDCMAHFPKHSCEQVCAGQQDKANMPRFFIYSWWIALTIEWPGGHLEQTLAAKQNLDSLSTEYPSTEVQKSSQTSRAQASLTRVASPAVHLGVCEVRICPVLLDATSCNTLPNCSPAFHTCA